MYGICIYSICYVWCVYTVCVCIIVYMYGMYCMYACINKCMYVCMWECMYVCTCEWYFHHLPTLPKWKGRWAQAARRTERGSPESPRYSSRHPLRSFPYTLKYSHIHFISYWYGIHLSILAIRNTTYIHTYTWRMRIHIHQKHRIHIHNIHTYTYIHTYTFTNLQKFIYFL